VPGSKLTLFCDTAPQHLHRSHGYGHTGDPAPGARPTITQGLCGSGAGNHLGNDDCRSSAAPRSVASLALGRADETRLAA